MLTNVVVLTFDGVAPFELCVVCEAWGIYRTDHGVPLLVGTDVYVQDNFEDADRSLRTTLCHFTTSTAGAPHLLESLDLTAGAPDGAQAGGLGLCLDPQSGTLFATTTDNDAGTAGRWWAFSR